MKIDLLAKSVPQGLESRLYEMLLLSMIVVVRTSFFVASVTHRI